MTSIGHSTLDEHVRALVIAALDAADDPTVPTSVITRKALRIARLRGDWPGLLWLLLELRAPGDEDAKRDAVEEVRPHFTSDEFYTMWSATTERYLVVRTIERDRVLGEPLAETEALASTLREHARMLAPGASESSGASAADRETAGRHLFRALEREQVLARVRQRVVDYLSKTERQVMSGQLKADVWERNRAFVDDRLRAVAPEALEQLEGAYRRQAERDPEARSQALTSCRRVLKSLADALYPATERLVEGADSVRREMTDERYIRRLVQFVTERTRRSRSREVLTSEVREWGRRLDSLNALASKGVHASVSEAELDQCVIQTYLTVGDLLRIEAGTSAVLSPIPE